VKSYLMGTVKAAADSPDDPNGSFEVILSAPTLDRDGEIIDANAFEPLPDHVTFDIDHGMSVATTVGSGAPRYNEKGQLVVAGTYSSIPRAQEVRTLVREGHIRTTSVAFMDAKRVTDKSGVTHITQAELLNGAFVPIPSNRESLVIGAKEYALKVGARNSTEDTSRLQQIHDMSVENGASCSGKSVRVIGAVRKFAGGLTANDLREQLTEALRAAHGAESTWVWVRDFADDWVVFEVEDAEHDMHMFRQSYSAGEDGVSLSGQPEPVTAKVTYVAAGEKPAEDDPEDTDEDPEAPDSEEESGNSPAPKSAAPATPSGSPASGNRLSEWVRARAEVIALS
jgi:phage head maturation protease